MCAKALNRVMNSEVSWWESASFTLLFIYFRLLMWGSLETPTKHRLKPEYCIRVYLFKLRCNKKNASSNRFN